MAITQALCSSFKQELLQGIHDLTVDTIKLALYTDAATLGPTTTAYSAANEMAASGAYSAGGVTLTPSVSLSGTVALVDFADVVLAGTTVLARGALIYNSSKADRAIMVLDFGSNKTDSSGAFTITFPPATADAALIRIA